MHRTYARIAWQSNRAICTQSFNKVFQHRTVCGWVTGLTPDRHVIHCVSKNVHLLYFFWISRWKNNGMLYTEIRLICHGFISKNKKMSIYNNPGICVICNFACFRFLSVHIEWQKDKVIRTFLYAGLYNNYSVYHLFTLFIRSSDVGGKFDGLYRNYCHNHETSSKSCSVNYL